MLRQLCVLLPVCVRALRTAPRTGFVCQVKTKCHGKEALVEKSFSTAYSCKFMKLLEASRMILPAVPMAKIKTAEKTSLIQTCRFIWPQLTTVANLEWTIKQLGLSCYPACLSCYTAYHFHSLTVKTPDLKPLVKHKAANIAVPCAMGISKGYCTVAETAYERDS